MNSFTSYVAFKNVVISFVVVCVGVCVCLCCSCSACRGQKGALDLVELELRQI